MRCVAIGNDDILNCGDFLIEGDNFVIITKNKHISFYDGRIYTRQRFKSETAVLAKK